MLITVLRQAIGIWKLFSLCQGREVRQWTTQHQEWAVISLNTPQGSVYCPSPLYTYFPGQGTHKLHSCFWLGPFLRPPGPRHLFSLWSCVWPAPEARPQSNTQNHSFCLYCHVCFGLVWACSGTLCAHDRPCFLTELPFLGLRLSCVPAPARQTCWTAAAGNVTPF